jgi:hypothetical protein
MSEDFDPYLKWLGIPPKHQPPHHYRLLGLEAFESDPDAIENAADRQMTHLRTFRNGKRVDLAERILNEIAEARVCLLNRERKEEYDAKLRVIEAKRQAAQKKRNGHAAKVAQPLVDESGDAARRRLPSGPTAKPIAVAAPPTPQSAPMAMPVAVAAESPSPSFVSDARTNVRRRKQTPVLALAVLGILLLGVAAVGALIAPSLLQSPDEIAKVEPAEQTATTPPATSIAGSPATSTAGAGSRATADDGVEKGTEEAEVPATSTNNEDRGSRLPRGDRPWTRRDPREPLPTAPPDDDLTSSEGDDEETNPSVEPPPELNPTPLPGTEEEGVEPPVSNPPAKLAAPADDVQKPIESRVKQLYKLADAKTPEAQLEVAKKLIADAIATRDNPQDKYVMLRVAADTASAQADVATALQAADVLVSDYEVEPSPLKLRLVEQAAKATAPPAQRQQALRDALPVLDAAISDNKFGEVDSLVTMLLAAARRVNDREISTALIDRRKTTLALKKQYDKAVAALETLKTNPHDPAANGTVGSFWAYAKDNWVKGLPYLAKGDEPASSAAAKLELAQGEAGKPAAGVDVAKLADQWFDLAKKQEPPAKYNILRHADRLYAQAQPEVTGLVKTGVEQRMEEIAKLLTAADAASAPISRMAQISASSDSAFELYINGEQVARGDDDEIVSFERELKPGDVLLVMAGSTRRGFGRFEGFRRSRGFASVIKFDADGSTIVTGQPNTWYTFTPANSDLWYDARGVANISNPQAADSDRHQELEQQTGVRNQSIWGGSSSRSYFVLRIP